MANYFLDTEFHEFEKPVKLMGFTVGKVPTIDLVSIGIVCEDGREYYAISNEFDLEFAWENDWLRENVLKKIHGDMMGREGNYVKTYHWELVDFTRKGMKNLLRWHGKTRKEIANEVKAFVGHPYYDQLNKNKTEPNFYGYFADYDWVVFCWLFGQMISLPSGFPYYCHDLKQMMHERGLSKEWKQENCPDPIGEHNALVDARWNFKLFNLINSVPIMVNYLDPKGSRLLKGGVSSQD